MALLIASMFAVATGVTAPVPPSALAAASAARLAKAAGTVVAAISSTMPESMPRATSTERISAARVTGPGRLRGTSTGGLLSVGLTELTGTSSCTVASRNVCYVANYRFSEFGGRARRDPRDLWTLVQILTVDVSAAAAASPTAGLSEGRRSDRWVAPAGRATAARTGTAARPPAGTPEPVGTTVRAGTPAPAGTAARADRTSPGGTAGPGGTGRAAGCEAAA